MALAYEMWGCRANGRAPAPPRTPHGGIGTWSDIHHINQRAYGHDRPWGGGEATHVAAKVGTPIRNV